MSIHNLYNKIKGESFSYIYVLIGVGACSFGLGRLSVDSTNNSNGSDKIIITQNPSLSQPESKQVLSETSTIKETEVLPPLDSTPEAMNYVASKNGKLYYPASCSGAKRISDKNRVWYSTADEAEESGLTLAPSCR